MLVNQTAAERRPEDRCDVVSHHVVLLASRFQLRWVVSMTPLLSVYHEDRERIGRNNSSHISLGNSSHSVRTMGLFLVFALLVLTGCASDRPPEKHPADRPIFDSPDVDTLH